MDEPIVIVMDPPTGQNTDCEESPVCWRCGLRNQITCSDPRNAGSRANPNGECVYVQAHPH